MDIATLTDLLEAKLGESIPVFFHHMFVEDGEELPPVYVVTDSQGINPFRADNKNYFMQVINTVTLYAATYREDLLAKVEKVLNDAAIPFDRETEYDEAELMFYTTYTVQLDD